MDFLRGQSEKEFQLTDHANAVSLHQRIVQHLYRLCDDPIPQVQNQQPGLSKSVFCFDDPEKNPNIKSPRFFPSVYTQFHLTLHISDAHIVITPVSKSV